MREDKIVNYIAVLCALLNAIVIGCGMYICHWADRLSNDIDDISESIIELEDTMNDFQESLNKLNIELQQYYYKEL